VPVIALSQLSRAVETRGGSKRPQLSDLRESGCLTGDTILQDADTGRLVTIKELAERKEQSPVKVLAMSDNYKIGAHTLTKAFYSGRKMTYELTTRSGRTIKASANHPFRKLEGWTALEDLSPGDRIAATESHSDIFWDEIKSITPLKEEDVYDATIEGVHNFVANDIIVHNSINLTTDVLHFAFTKRGKKGLLDAPHQGQLDTLIEEIEFQLETNEDLMQTIRPVHEFATNAMIVLIAIHVVAALQHHFVAKDRSTTKMLKFWKSERNSAG